MKEHNMTTSDGFDDAPEPKFGDTFWTAFIAWPLDEKQFTSTQQAIAAAKRGDASIEEIDVTCAHESEARVKVKAILAADYEPGGVIVRWERRMHGLIYM